MMLKKTALSLMVLLVCITFFVSCSSSQAPEYSEAPAVASEAPDYDVPAEDDYLKEEVTTEETAAGEAGRVDTAQYEPKIIRNAEVSLEVADVEESYRKILDWAGKNGGYESSRNMETISGITDISATIKIKAEKLDAFLAHIESVGKVMDSNISSDEVTDQYYDLETRIQTMRKTLSKYYEFLEATKTVDEMLKVQRSIDELTVEIESLEGQLRLLKSKVAESIVTLRLWAIPDPVVQEEEIAWNALSFADMLTLTGRTFSRVGSFLVSLLQWVVIYSPILILLAILLLVIRLLVKRHRKKHPKPVYPAYGQGFGATPVPPTAPPVATVSDLPNSVPGQPSDKENGTTKKDQ